MWTDSQCNTMAVLDPSICDIRLVLLGCLLRMLLITCDFFCLRKHLLLTSDLLAIEIRFLVDSGALPT